MINNHKSVRWRRIFSCCLFFLSITLTLSAQDLLVTGKITDGLLPISGASIIIKNTTTGAVSDFDGRYTITARPTDTLQISYLGYTTQTIPVHNRLTIDVQLLEDAMALGEVQINAGYYTTTDRERTGSIVRVTGEDIRLQPIVSPMEALQGRMAGVEIEQRDGMPGNAPIIRIRGRNSLREEGNYPLYVIDGVPINSEPISVGALLEDGLDPLSTLNLSNIESIEVLKDADATAIYGSRGANGVVLITSKKGRLNQKNQIQSSWYSGFGEIAKKVKLLNTQQYLQLRQEAIYNVGREPNIDNDWDLLRWNTDRYTDWQDVILGGKAETTNANISMSGGNATTSFRLGGSFHKQGTVLPIDMDYKKMTASVSLNHVSEDKKLTINLSTNFGVDKTFSNITYSILPLAFELPPNAPPLYNHDGSLHWEEWTYSSWANPLANKYNPYDGQVQNLITNLGVSYQLNKDLQLRTSFGYTQNIQESKGKRFIEGVSPELRDKVQHSASRNYHKRVSEIIESQLVYNKILSKGTFDGLVGTTFQQNESDGFNVNGTGFVTKALVGYMPAAETVSSGQNRNIRYRYNGLFGRLGYNWDKKYYVNLTGRRDGSSRFGPNKRFSNFWAVGTAWIFTEETFFENITPLINFGKLRASYGTTGSDQIGDYQYLDSYEATDAPGGLYPTRLFNADFAWEENKKLEAAMQLGLFKDRVNLGVSWYRNRSSNQLVGYPLAATAGFASVQANLPATVQNTGWEFDLSSTNFQSKAFTWRTSVNLSIPKNKLIAFPDIDQTVYAQQYRIGYPLNIRLLYQSDGIDPETGYHRVVDINGDGSFSYEDRVVIKNLGRKFYGGINNDLKFKQWNLKFLWDFTKQNSRSWGRGYPGRDKTNRPYWEYLAWQDSAIYIEDSPAANTGYNLTRDSEKGIEDASFIRLKTLTLSYHLPEAFLEKTGIKSFNIFISAQNLFTITPYKGINVEHPRFPETLPPLRTFISGIQITL